MTLKGEQGRWASRRREISPCGDDKRNRDKGNAREKEQTPTKDIPHKTSEIRVEREKATPQIR